jgi:hypothetical protein
MSFVPGVPEDHKYPEKQSKGTKKTKLISKPSKKAIMSKFETSISKMKSSFDAIAAAKTHTVVLDFVPSRKTTGKAGATTKTTTKVVKPVEYTKKPVEYTKKPVEYTKKPEGLPFVLAGDLSNMPAKKQVVKSAKLKKLLRGKATFDCSA